MNDLKVGDRVKYTKKNSENHTHIEFGFITSIKDNRIWVRYDIQNPTADGQLTPKNDLLKIQNEANENKI